MAVSKARCELYIYFRGFFVIPIAKQCTIILFIRYLTLLDTSSVPISIPNGDIKILPSEQYRTVAVDHK